MRIKSYFADSVQEAIEKARVELGPDAMLMNSKKTEFELRALGSVEVVFGIPSPAPVTKPRLQVASLPETPVEQSDPNPARLITGAPIPSDVVSELADLRRQIETVKRSVARQQRPVSPCEQEGKFSPVANDLCARLVASGLSEETAAEVAQAVEVRAFALKEHGGRGLRDFEMLPAESVEVALRAELERRIQTLAQLGVAGERRKLVLLAGPPGAGKTSSLIKIALRYGLQARLPMHLLSLDTLRVGGWEQLAAYARIAGLGFDPVHNLNALDQAIAQHSDKRLILIDTPGFGPAEAEDLQSLADWSLAARGVDTHLVLPATFHPAVARRIFARFAGLRPAKLLLTHIDEIDVPGRILEPSLQSGLPLSFLCNGQQVPEDIQEGMSEPLVASLLSKSRPASSQAA